MLYSFLIAIPRCIHPKIPKLGSIVGGAKDFPIGSIVRFQCDKPGYALSGIFLQKYERNF